MLFLGNRTILDEKFITLDTPQKEQDAALSSAASMAYTSLHFFTPAHAWFARQRY
jgi:hypothetical protein